MKTTVLILLAVLLAPFAGAEAVAPTVSEFTYFLESITASASTGTARAVYRATVELSDGTKVRPRQKIIEWELAGAEPVSITLADGATAQTTRAAVFAAVVAIAAAETAAQGAPVAALAPRTAVEKEKLPAR